MEATLIKTIVLEQGITKVYDNGFIESSVYEDAYIDVDYLNKGKEELLKIGLNKKYFVLTEGPGYFRITREARELSASREYSDHMAAIAVKINHLAVRLAFDLYHKINKPVVPTRAFNDRLQAIHWLEGMMEKDAILKFER